MKQKSWCIGHTVYVVFRGQLANGCQWQHTISLMCKLRLLPCSWCGIPMRLVCDAALCVCERVEVQRCFALDVFVIRGEAQGLWVALRMDWLFRCRGSGGPCPHICADIPQHAEIKGSGGNLTLVMTPLVLPSQAWPSLESRRMRSESIIMSLWIEEGHLQGPNDIYYYHLTVLELRWL